jgi:hypothetical protein
MPESTPRSRALQEFLTEVLGTTVRYRRLYATADGHSHVEVLGAELQRVDYAPPALPLLLTAFQPATQWGFLVFPVGWRGQRHPSPVRQLLILLAGQVGVETSDGEQLVAHPGEVAFLEDTTGLGHESWNAGDCDALMVAVQLPA